jgi:hypothetical protein
LWIAKVHHFIQQLVDDDKVVPDRFFLQLFKIFGEDFDDLMEKEEDFRSVGVTLGKGKKVKIIMPYVQIL